MTDSFCLMSVNTEIGPSDTQENAREDEKIPTKITVNDSY